jgi:hypothetical protein
VSLSGKVGIQTWSRRWDEAFAVIYSKRLARMKISKNGHSVSLNQPIAGQKAGRLPHFSAIWSSENLSNQHIYPVSTAARQLLLA